MEINITNSGDEKFEALIGNGKDSFALCYGGSDFYWILDDYYNKCNTFVISENDKDLYLIFENLFEKIREDDNKNCPTLKDNVFEWVSEAREPEISNKLIITKEENEFIIEFIKNPDDIFGWHMCAICFCLSGSRNPKIVCEFSKMFQDFIYKSKGIKRPQKILKK